MSGLRAAVVFGAGNVGCGVVAEQLAPMCPVVMVTRTRAAARRLDEGRVRVRYTGEDARPEVVVRPASVLPVGDARAITDQVRTASLVVLAVGAAGYAAIAPVLAAGLERRRTPVNVVVCDNRDGAAAQVRAMVAEHGDDRVLSHGYVGALVDRIVSGSERADGCRVLRAEAEGRVYLDARALRAPVATTEQLRLVEGFRAHVVRKLFVFSAGHAAAAYLGQVRGHRLLADAVRDDQVARVVRAAMREGQAGLAACFGDRFAGGADDIEHIVRRFSDPGIGDTVERVGRDPLRKLTARDRICGPARLATAAGARTPALALVAAAALRSAASDPDLCARLVAQGTAATLARQAGLGPGHPFLGQVLEASRLLAGGTAPGAALEALTGRVVGSARSTTDVQAGQGADR